VCRADFSMDMAENFMHDVEMAVIFLDKNISKRRDKKNV